MKNAKQIKLRPREALLRAFPLTGIYVSPNMAVFELARAGSATAQDNGKGLCASARLARTGLGLPMTLGRTVPIH